MNSKIRNLIFNIALILMISGCLPVCLSIYPLHEDGDVVFEDTLLGEWKAVESPRFLSVTKGDNSSYLFTYDNQDFKTVDIIKGNLVKINNKFYLDLFGDKDVTARTIALPVHYFRRIEITNNTVFIYDIDPNALEGLIKKRIYKYSFLKLEDQTILLTASTSQLQEFFKNIEKRNINLFVQAESFTKQQPVTPEKSSKYFP